MSNPAIPRDQVHTLSEACAAAGMSFQTIAKRALENQSRVVRFFKSNIPVMADQPGEVSLYLLAVVVRIFEQSGGKLDRAGAPEIERATAKVQAAVKSAGLMPVGADFPERVRSVADRAQPHILDEALHALFEREDRKDGEIEMDPEQSALVFLMLWAATEALDAAWRGPRTVEAKGEA